MSNTPNTEERIMRQPAPDDEIMVRYMLPSRLVTEIESGLMIRTCQGGVVTVPRSVLAKSNETEKVGSDDLSPGVLIEIQTKRAVAELLGSLIAEISRLTFEINELQAGS